MPDPDDLHVCLKCQDQIVGLENYIEHRRSDCKGKPDEGESPGTETEDNAKTDDHESSDIAKELASPSKPSQRTSDEAETAPPLKPTEEEDAPASAPKPDTVPHPQKRKRGRPRKISRPEADRPKTASPPPAKSPPAPGGGGGGEARSGRPTRRRLQVPARYSKDMDYGDENDGDKDNESSYEVPAKKTRGPKRPKVRKWRNTKLVLSDDDKATLAQYKVGKFYRCKPCNIRNTNLHALLKHVKTVKHLESVASGNPEVKFKCETCSLVFFTEVGLSRHSLRHEQQSRCSKCILVFDSRRELQEHHKVDHAHPPQRASTSSTATAPVSSMQACEICGKVLSRGYMKIHARIHTGEKPFACDLCPFRTNQQGDLKMHQKRHFGIKDHKCSLCNFVTVKASILKNHMKLHTKRERTEACHLCPQKFFNQGLLKSHIHLRHEPSRVHLCTFPGCTYKFKCKIDLVTHTRRHTNEKPFLCTICGYAGSTKQALARHSRKHTGAKPFKCDHPGCSYMGRVSTHLTRHKRLHTGAKPYKCPYCSYRANTHENVRKHIRNTKKHAGLSVYACKFCADMQTDKYQELVDHMRTVHAEDYVTFDQVSHQMGLLADKEEIPKVPVEPSKESLTTKLSEDLQLALESDRTSQDLLTSDSSRLAVQMEVASEEAAVASDEAESMAKQGLTQSLQLAPADAQAIAADAKESLCKEYIICRVIQEDHQQGQPHEGVAVEAPVGSEVIGQEGDMQEIQMVTVEGQSEAIEMILRQAVSNGTAGHQDYIIL